MKWWKTFQMASGVEWEESTRTERYGRFVIQPLERGFGTTLGNPLRRILLSSLPGAAVIGLKIEGVLHEFSTVPGVVEDVTEIVLNMKQLRLKMHSSDPKVLHLSATKKGEVRASAIEPNADVDILNPELKIATLSDGAKLAMEIYLDRGRGYIPADMLREPTQPIGYIPVDAIFTPIEKVNIVVENARVEEKTDYDRLIMEVWTDGSIRPEEAFSRGAKLLKDHLGLLITGEDKEKAPQEELLDEESTKLRDLLAKPVDELELSVRSSNCLKGAGIKILGELVVQSEDEMLEYRNFGRKSLSELNEILQGLGLTFGMKLNGFEKKPLPKTTKATKGTKEGKK